MEPMDPTAEITGINISFMGWDGPQNKSQKAATVPELSVSVHYRDYTLT